MNIKKQSILFLLVLCLVFAFSSLALALPLGHWEYTGEYAILRQDGFEANYKVEMTKQNKDDVKICIIADQWAYLNEEKAILEPVPDTLKIYDGKVEEIEEKPINERELEIIKASSYKVLEEAPFVDNTEKGYKEVCHIANPRETPYLKFGDNSIEVYASQVYVTNATGTNITIEPNFAHLSLADPSIVAYYPLDNTHYNTVTQTYDYSDNNNDGNLTGYVFNHGTRLNNQQGSLFNTKNTSILIPSIKLGANEFSISLWYKYINSSQYDAIFKFSNSSVDRFYCEFWSGSTQIDCYNDLGDSSTQGIITGGRNYQQIYNLMIVFNSTNVSYYLDNVLKLQNPRFSSGLNFSNSYNLTLGNNQQSQNAMNGSMFSFQFYNKSLNSSEITSIYNAGKCAVSPIGDKLIAQYILCNQSDMNSESLPYWQGSYSNSSHVYDVNNQVEGKGGKGDISQNFNGKTNYDLMSPLNLTKDSFTIGLTINTYYPNTLAWGVLSIRNATVTSTGDFNIWANANETNLGFRLYNRTGSDHSCTVTGLKNNTNYYFTIIYNSTSKIMYIYKDSIVQCNRTIVGTLLNNHTGILLGTYFDRTSTRSFAGSISDLIIFNRSLSATEVAQLYAGTFPIYKNGGYLNSTLSVGNMTNATLNFCTNESNLTLTTNLSSVAQKFSLCTANRHLLNNSATTDADVRINFLSNSYFTPLIYSDYNINTSTITQYYNGVQNTITIESGGYLNTSIAITAPLNVTKIVTANNYIFLDTYARNLSNEWLKANITITSFNGRLSYTPTTVDLPTLVSSTNTIKTINNPLSDSFTAVFNLTTTYCNNSAKDRLNEVTISQGSVLSYVCNNDTTLIVTATILSGITTMTLVRQNSAILINNWAATFASMFGLLIVVVMLAVAMGYMLPLFGKDENNSIDLRKATIILVLSAILFAIAIIIFSYLAV